MSTYREAIARARSGETVHRAGKTVRFLTTKEAEPILLERCPERRTVRDEKGRMRLVDKDGKLGAADQDADGEHIFVGDDGKTIPVRSDHQIVVETIAPPNYPTKRLGLYDVSQTPPVPFAAVDDDIYEPVELDAEGKEKPRVLRTDWEIVAINEAASEAVPEAVSPEAVDEVLNEGPVGFNG